MRNASSLSLPAVSPWDIRKREAAGDDGARRWGAPFFRYGVRRVFPLDPDRCVPNLRSSP